MSTVSTLRQKPDPKELGRRGEVFAAGWLTGRGYRVLARNWRCNLGELDVIAADAGDLVAVEVKTRSGSGYGEPAEAVGREKLARLYRLIHAYAREHPSGAAGSAGSARAPLPRRVDVLSLVWPPGEPVPTHVEHYEAVTP